MQNYTKAFAAFIGSAIALLGVFGIHSGWLNDPTNQNILATVLAMGIPALTTYLAPHNTPSPAPVPPAVHVATATAAAGVAVKAAQDAAAALSSLLGAPANKVAT